MKTFVIAECGVNHQGEIEKAVQLIDHAKEAGADAVKFQMFDPDKVPNGDKIRHLALSKDDFVELYHYCQEVGIEFMVTPFDVEAVRFLDPMVKRHKIGSGCRKPDILQAVADAGKPVLISMGMSTETEITEVMQYFHPGVVTMMHCVSSYPCEMRDANLYRIQSYWNMGYSDHTQGILAPIVAVALGATVIEKHLTYDIYAEGPDHKCSIVLDQFADMVDKIRQTEILLGSSEIKVYDCEKELRGIWYGS